MTPTKETEPPKPSQPNPVVHSPASAPKNKDLKMPNLKSWLPKMYKRFGKHMVFGALLLVLLIYIFVVFRISQLSNAEPTAEQTSQTASLIPKINQNAINQIQSLANNNTQIQALFEQARNNPFEE